MLLFAMDTHGYTSFADTDSRALASAMGTFSHGSMARLISSKKRMARPTLERKENLLARLVAASAFLSVVVKRWAFVAWLVVQDLRCLSRLNRNLILQY